MVVSSPRSARSKIAFLSAASCSLIVDPIQRSGYQLLDQFRVQIQALARFYGRLFLTFAYNVLLGP
ncbi:hypothetical protein WK80_21305 [Burkholderia multivorans]|nr:hypothetical protein WK80_21305 [Burkholderia multivorans]